MRIAGVLLTVAALAAVQAPWIVCGCVDDPGCQPAIFGVLEHGVDVSDEGCCDGAAHIAHGHRHHHHCHGDAGKHCHGSYAHRHGEDDEPGEPEPSEHVGFRLPIATMPPAVDLDAPAVAPAVLALIFDAVSLETCDGTVFARSAGPPGAPPIPAGSTERLLL